MCGERVRPLMDFTDPMRVVGMLGLRQQRRPLGIGSENGFERACRPGWRFLRDIADLRIARHLDRELGRASWRERVCQYVLISVVAVYLKKKKNEIKSIE